MAAITAPWDTQVSSAGSALEIKPYYMAVEKIYEGAQVNLNSSGYVENAADTSGETFVGVAYETVDNSGGSAGDKVIRIVKNGTHIYKLASAALTDLGATVSSGTNNDQAETSPTNVTIGTIVKIFSDLQGTQATSGDYVGVRIVNYTL